MNLARALMNWHGILGMEFWHEIFLACNTGMESLAWNFGMEFFGMFFACYPVRVLLTLVPFSECFDLILQ